MSHAAATGLENGVSAIGSASATPSPLGVRLTRYDSVVESSCARHGFAPNRPRLIRVAFDLMTDSASDH